MNKMVQYVSVIGVIAFLAACASLTNSSDNKPSTLPSAYPAMEQARPTMNTQKDRTVQSSEATSVRKYSKVTLSGAEKTALDFFGNSAKIAKKTTPEKMLWLVKNAKYNRLVPGDEDTRIFVTQVEGEFFPVTSGEGEAVPAREGLVAIRESDGAIIFARWK